MPRHLDHETLVSLRLLHDEFLGELRSKGYAPNTVQTYEKTIDPWLRWLDGSWVPEGPRLRRGSDP